MMSRIAKLGVVLGVLMVIAAVVYWQVGWPVVEQPPAPPPAAEHPTINWAELPESMGPADAPVALTVFYSKATCFAGATVEMGLKVAEKYPEQVQVRFLDMAAPETQELAQECGIVLLNAMAVNGKCHFTLAGEEGERSVSLEGPVMASGTAPVGGYCEGDVIECIEVELEMEEKAP